MMERAESSVWGDDAQIVCQEKGPHYYVIEVFMCQKSNRNIRTVNVVSGMGFY